MIRKIAVVDPASFSLPYDVSFIEQLVDTKESISTDFYCSVTRYNFSFLKILNDNPRVTTFIYKISGRSKVRAAVSYMSLLVDLFKRRRDYDRVIVEWAIFFPIDLIIFLIFRNRIHYVVHNHVPHGSKEVVRPGTFILSMLADKLIFVSKYTALRFNRVYGSYFCEKFIILKHPFLPLISESGNKIDIESVKTAEFGRLVFWGTVKKYKGVQRFLDLPAFMVNQFRPIVIGKWDRDLDPLKSQLLVSGIEILDDYVPMEYLAKFIAGRNIFILPYSDSTQSGVLYTLMGYAVPTVCSNVGDNADFMRQCGLSELLFDLNDNSSMSSAIERAFFSYEKYSKAIKLGFELEVCRQKSELHLYVSKASE